MLGDPGLRPKLCPWSLRKVNCVSQGIFYPTQQANIHPRFQLCPVLLTTSSVTNTTYAHTAFLKCPVLLTDNAASFTYPFHSHTPLHPNTHTHLDPYPPTTHSTPTLNGPLHPLPSSLQTRIPTQTLSRDSVGGN